MCMIYNDVAYRYAFEFKAPIEHSSVKKLFHIIISDYMDDSQEYSGICLENGIIVSSNKRIPYEAFFDIINKIIGIIHEIEKAYVKTHSEGRLKSIKYVDNTCFLKQFIKKNKFEKSLDYYESLNSYFEKPELLSKNISEKIKLDLCDYPNMLLLSSLIRNKAPQLKECKFLRI